jgi:hypothetical protein
MWPVKIVDNNINKQQKFYWVYSLYLNDTLSFNASSTLIPDEGPLLET